jgi:hypothetical protein
MIHSFVYLLSTLARRAGCSIMARLRPGTKEAPSSRDSMTRFPVCLRNKEPVRSDPGDTRMLLKRAQANALACWGSADDRELPDR